MNWDRWPNFREDEFRCKHCGMVHMAPEFLDTLQALRSHCGFPFVVSSGYRCPVHNKAVSSTGPRGPHTTGRAVDVAAAGAQALYLVRSAVAFGFTGVGVKQKGPHAGRFIHLDDLGDHETSGPRPWLWSY